MGSQFVKQEWKSLQEVTAMQAWSPAACTITKSNVEDQGNDFRLTIEYTYTADGKAYSGSRYGRRSLYTSETIGDIK